MRALLFYANQLVDELEYPDPIGFNKLGRLVQSLYGHEIYNGGYLYAAVSDSTPCRWWRCDLTPLLDDEVPKELRLLLVLLN
jgi:hypothetical protein